MNTRETHVSLETAKLLKQAGFDWKCRGIYVLDSENDPEYVFSTANFTNTSKEIEGYIRLSAPTLSVTQKWLREVKNIFIEVTRYETIHPLARELLETVYDKTVDKSFAYGVNVLDANNESIYDEDCFLTYEEALEAGIKKCLEEDSITDKY